MESFIERALIAFVMVGVVLSVYYTIKKISIKRKAKRKYASQEYASLKSLNPAEVKGDVKFFYELPKSTKVCFNILDEKYDLVMEIENIEKEAGDHMVKFNSTQLSNGNYFYQLSTPNQKVTKKFVIEN